jgi:hypothetical protein
MYPHSTTSPALNLKFKFNISGKCKLKGMKKKVTARCCTSTMLCVFVRKQAHVHGI